MRTDRTPLIVITGFLGSGKTTLLQGLLDSPDFADTAVLINEVGAIAIDHALVGYVEENVVVIANGCLCCAVRDDLGKALRDLLARRGRGEVSFKRIAVETTGIADPTPILNTLMTDPVIDVALAIESVVTTVDAVNAAAHSQREPEWIKQVAVADVLVVTKTDVDGAEPAGELVDRLRRINPQATIMLAADVALRPGSLLGEGSWDADRLGTTAGLSSGRFVADAPNAHEGTVAAYSFFIDEALDWTGFAVWFSLFLHRHGTQVLRAKALLNIAGEPGPVALHGVQHVVHPPVHLDRWPDADRRSRFVFIGRAISADAITASLLSFSRAAKRERQQPSAVQIVVSPVGTEVSGRPLRRNSGLAWMKRAMIAAPDTSTDRGANGNA